MIEYQIQNRVATITLNRPDKKNALNPAMVQALDQAVSDARQVLTAADAINDAAIKLSFGKKKHVLLRAG